MFAVLEWMVRWSTWSHDCIPQLAQGQCSCSGNILEEKNILVMEENKNCEQEHPPDRQYLSVIIILLLRFIHLVCVNFVPQTDKFLPVQLASDRCLERKIKVSICFLSQPDIQTQWCVLYQQKGRQVWNCFHLHYLHVSCNNS